MPVKRSPEESIHITMERAFEEKAREDVRRIRRAVVTLSRGLVAQVMVTHLVATIIVTIVTFTNPFPYPAMYLLMGLLLWLIAAIRFTAWDAQRRVSAMLLLIVNLVMNGFWIAVIVDQIPGQRVVTGKVIMRPDLPVLWVSIALYMLAMAGMLAHSIINWKRRRSGKT